MVEKIHQETFGFLKVANGSSGQKSRNLQIAVEEFEKQFITETLEQNRGHRGKTAAMLGIDRKTLYMKLKKYGVIYNQKEL